MAAVFVSFLYLFFNDLQAEKAKIKMEEESKILSDNKAKLEAIKKEQEIIDAEKKKEKGQEIMDAEKKKESGVETTEKIRQQAVEVPSPPSDLPQVSKNKNASKCDSCFSKITSQNKLYLTASERFQPPLAVFVERKTKLFYSSFRVAMC